MVKPSTADANLLFGVLALQMEFISREQLIAGMQAWVNQKQSPLAEHLVQAGALKPEDRAALEPLIAAHLRRHGDDPEKSLAAISSAANVKQDLHCIADADVQNSILHLRSKRSPNGSEVTMMIGASSSEGTRFQILRPHARGGLGEVFVARDTELGREVALKEIQLDKDDVDSRARFTREAEITGGLEHPGIVPVYGLGAYPDGRPFYAMRFIRGKSLLDAIKAFHSQRDAPASDAAGTGSPAEVTPNAVPLLARRATKSSTEQNLELRRLLQRFIDVCEAIDYAHSRGVLHRDLKPGNIMLGRYGETLVVDWGLAKPLPETADDPSLPPSLDTEAKLQPRSGESSATMQGTAIGTPAYMPPEQAEGRLDLLCPASDVYSLGATLYSILTGQPPVGGQNVEEVLENVRRGNILPPRAINTSIPRSLEAVCLKALALSISQRYARARQLASDVERYLADEPIEAFREPLLSQARRWVRRHQTLATSTAVGLVSVTLFLAALAAVVLKTNERLNIANHKLGETNHKLSSANAALDHANQKLEKSNTDLTAAVALAQDQNKLALETLNYVVFQIDEELGKVPGAGKVRRALLQGVLERVQKVSDQYQSRAAIDHNSMVALVSLADLLLRIGSVESAAPAKEKPGSESAGAVTAARALFQRALTMAQAVAAADPRNAQAQRDLSASYNKLGDLALRSGDVAAAREHYEQGLKIIQALAAADATAAQTQGNLAISHNNLGDLALRSGDVAAAREHYEQGLKIRQALVAANTADAHAQRGLTLNYNSLGDVALRLGDVATAREHYEQGLKISQALAAADPADAQAQRGLSRSYNMLGDPLLQSGDVAAAREHYEQGLKIRQALAAADPADAQAQRDLSLSYSNLGNIALQSGAVTKAREHHEQALKISQALAAADPSDALAQRDLLVSYSKLGNIAMLSEELPAAREHFEQALKISQALAATDPRDAQAQRDLSVIYEKLGSLELQSGDVAAARENYERCLKISESLAAADPRDAQAQRDLSVSYQMLGNMAMRSGELAAARKHYEQFLKISQALAAADPRDAQAQRGLWVSYNRLGDLALRSGAVAAAREYYEQGLKVSQALAAADPADAQAQRDLSVSYGLLGNIALQSGELAAAREHYERCLKISQALATDPRDAQVQRDLMVTHYNLGKLGQEEKNWDMALKSFQAGQQILFDFHAQTKLDVFQRELADLKKRIEFCEAQIKASKADADKHEQRGGVGPTGLIAISYNKLGTLCCGQACCEGGRVV